VASHEPATYYEGYEPEPYMEGGCPWVILSFLDKGKWDDEYSKTHGELIKDHIQKYLRDNDLSHRFTVGLESDIGDATYENGNTRTLHPDNCIWGFPDEWPHFPSHDPRGEFENRLPVAPMPKGASSVSRVDLTEHPMGWGWPLVPIENVSAANLRPGKEPVVRSDGTKLSMGTYYRPTWEKYEAYKHSGMASVLVKGLPFGRQFGREDEDDNALPFDITTFIGAENRMCSKQWGPGIRAPIQDIPIGNNMVIPLDYEAIAQGMFRRHYLQVDYTQLPPMLDQLHPEYQERIREAQYHIETSREDLWEPAMRRKQNQEQFRNRGRSR
jgi:hypothetical protein